VKPIRGMGEVVSRMQLHARLRSREGRQYISPGRTSLEPSMTMPPFRPSLRRRAHEVVVGHDTPAGKAFDVVLIWLIVASVGVVMLESVQGIRDDYGAWLRGAEWAFTIVFTAEYLLRLWCVPSALGYAGSFFGLVDLVAILPTYLSLVIPGGQALLTVRALRLLRVFRVLKLAHYMSATAVLVRALGASRHKIGVFLLAVLTLVMTLGSLMYLVEGSANGFTSIPVSVYWAIVTLTTVGYGDITPHTVVGQFLAAIIMILGYAIIAVPTGIVTVEIGAAARQAAQARSCPQCAFTGHDSDAQHCKRCGQRLA
jgi:voltage-gated potassium channel